MNHQSVGCSTLLKAAVPFPLADIHTEAVQAALAKHKEQKMALPMPTKRRSTFVQSPADACTPPGEAVPDSAGIHLPKRGAAVLPVFQPFTQLQELLFQQFLENHVLGFLGCPMRGVWTWMVLVGPAQGVLWFCDSHWLD